jgi:putrescine aminotransferase
MTTTADLYARHVNPAFVKLLGVLGYGRVFVRALDVWLWDEEGRRYFDALAAFGAANLGHNHPGLLARVREHLSSEAPNLLHVGPSGHAARLGAALASALRAPLEISLFSSSGAEAVEAGLKLARAATGRRGFVSCDGGFHGTNLGVLSIMGDERMRRPFEPLLADCHRVPFGDLAALKKALARKPAAFVVEPIQGESGVVLPPPGYLAEAQELCRGAGTVLVLDEVQTGIGRTGTTFAFEAEGFVPDVIALAKSLGGGLAAIGATVTSRELHERAYGSIDRFDLHSSTFAGNALACAAALATLDIVKDEGLVAKSAASGARLLDGLRRRVGGHPFVKEIRGRGALVGLELGPTGAGWFDRLAASVVEQVSERVFGQWLALRLLENGIVAQPASQQWNVLKLEPPLTAGDGEIDALVDAIGRVLDDYRSLPPLLKDVTARLGKQWRGGFRF